MANIFYWAFSAFSSVCGKQQRCACQRQQGIQEKQRSFYPPLRGRDYPLNWRLGGPQSRSGRFVEKKTLHVPAEIPASDLPARRQSLYRPRHPGVPLFNEPEDESLNTIYMNFRLVTISPSRCSLTIGIENTTPDILISIRSVTPYMMASTDSVTHYTLVILQQFYVLPTQCIYVFCVDLGTNSDYFPIQH